MRSKGRILVTGGTGLVGTPITRLLIRDGWQVIIASRNPPAAPLLPNSEWLPFDLRSGNADALKHVAGVDFCIHCAADLKDANDRDSMKRMVRVNGLATLEILEWCSRAGVSRFVLISSLSVLRKPLQSPVRECDPVGPCTVYGMSKLLAEEAVFRHSIAERPDSVILRISSPIPATREDLPQTVVRRWLTAAHKGETMIVYGSGSRSQDFVSCDDIAAAALAAVTNRQASGIYNIGSGSSLSMLHLAQLLKERVGGRIEFHGSDPNEDDRCTLSILRARSELLYEPRMTGLQAIERILW
jgi:UDP-glucose 4-epimerase